MSAVEWLCQAAGANSRLLTKEENQLLEGMLFADLCKELKSIFKADYQNFFHIMRFNTEMEETMLEVNFIRSILRDIAETNAYSIEGIAYYTNSFEEVIADILAGRNTNPSFFLSRRIIELHKTIRPEIYQEILKKIMKENSKE